MTRRRFQKPAFSEPLSVFRAELQTPFFEGGQLRSSVSWLDHSRCTPHRRDFTVKLSSLRCPVHSSSQQLVSQCLAQLEDLQFSCDYLVEVVDGEDQEVRTGLGHLLTTLNSCSCSVADAGFVALTPLFQLLTKVSFSTPPCSRTPAADQLDCARLERRPDAQPLVSCLPSNHDETNAVECEWALGGAEDGALVGFRAVLHSSSDREAQVNIVPAHVHRLRFADLSAGTDYRLQVSRSGRIHVCPTPVCCPP